MPAVRRKIVHSVLNLKYKAAPTVKYAKLLDDEVFLGLEVEEIILTILIRRKGIGCKKVIILQYLYNLGVFCFAVVFVAD